MAYLVYFNTASATDKHIAIPTATYHGNLDTYEFQFVLKVEGGSASVIPINAASGFSDYINFGVTNSITRVRYNGTTLQWDVNVLPDDGNYHLMRVIRRAGGEHEIIRHTLDEQGAITDTTSYGTVTNAAKSTNNLATFGRTSGGEQSYRMKRATLLDAENGTPLNDWQPDGVSSTVIDSVGGATGTPVGVVTFEEYVGSNNNFLLDAELQYGELLTGSFANLSTDAESVITITDGTYTAEVSITPTGTTSGTFTTDQVIPLPAKPSAGATTSVSGYAWMLNPTPVTLTLNDQTTESVINPPTGYASVVIAANPVVDIFTNSGWTSPPVEGETFLYETRGNTSFDDQLNILGSDLVDDELHCYLVRADGTAQSFFITSDNLVAYTYEGGVEPPANVAPVANAGANQSVAAAATVTLNATASADSDGTIVSYQWMQTAGDSVTLSDATVAQPTFTAPSTNAQQTLTFELTVTDDDGATHTDTVAITVAAVPNVAPVANAGVDQSVAAGVEVTLDGSGSTDGDGSIVGYSWNQTGGATVSLANANTVAPSFTAPVSGSQDVLEFDLTVTDDRGATHTDSVQITVAAEVTTSTLNLSASGMPNGTYKTRLFSGNTLVLNQSLTYVNGDASVVLNVLPETDITGYVIDNQTPTINGAVLTGQTV